MQVDIIVDATGKESQLCREEVRRIVEAQVQLKTMLRLELMIAHLIAHGTFVHTIAAQLTHVGSAEAP